MLEFFYASAGIILIMLVFKDIVWTMMGEGAGFLTRRLTGVFVECIKNAS
jgi:hypothetical protein